MRYIPNRHNVRSTAGPSSPVHWVAEPLLDIGDLNEEDIFAGEGNAIGASGASTQDDFDSKPIDLNAYKEKLQKKMGIPNLKEVKDRKGGATINANPNTSRSNQTFSSRK